jgi:hypothetical protein
MTDKEISDNHAEYWLIEQVDDLVLQLLKDETGGVHGGFKWKLEIEYEEEEQ